MQNYCGTVPQINAFDAAAGRTVSAQTLRAALSAAAWARTDCILLPKDYVRRKLGSVRATDAAGLGTPISTWSAGASLTGNGSVQNLQDSSTSAVRFFVVEVLR